MTELFGHRWTSAVGGDPTPLWSATCGEFTDEEFHRAVSTLKNFREEWPPSLPEFRRWAIGGMTREEAKLLASQRAEAEVQRRLARHNPFGSPMTYDQADRLRTRLEREYFAEAVGESKGAPGAIEQDRGPRRICRDEEYR